MKPIIINFSKFCMLHSSKFILIKLCTIRYSIVTKDDNLQKSCACVCGERDTERERDRETDRQRNRDKERHNYEDAYLLYNKQSYMNHQNENQQHDLN